MQVVTILGLAFALLVAVFAIQNSTPVTVTFLKWRIVDASLALVILGSAAAGAVVVGLLGAVREIGLRFSLRSLRGKAERLAHELEAAREKAASLEGEVARLENEARAKARELEAARERVEALEVELEATQAMEILPRAQDEIEAEAEPSAGDGAKGWKSAGTSGLSGGVRNGGNGADGEGDEHARDDRHRPSGGRPGDQTT